MFEQFDLARAARRVDLVHLCDHRPILASRTPFVMTIHDVLFLDHPEWFPPAVARYKAAMLRTALKRRPQAVACVSDYTRSRLIHHYPEASEISVVILNGVERSEAVPAGEGASYFLTVSTIEPRKNHLLLLEAFRRAKAAGFELRWKIVGAPGYLSRPIINALRAEPGVDVLGHVPEDSLDRLYRDARFVASPSLAEGFGFPPLEAMTRGAPVVCSQGSSFDEVVADAGLRVPATDADAWSEALRRLQDDDDLVGELRARGLARSTAFPWQAAARAYVELYERPAGLKPAS
jgi:glycosyltransferase involved in cell wall biosynthesis